MGVSGTLHHAAFHRFFSRARWSLDEVGRLLLLKLVALAPGPLRLVLDDTLCTHKGPKVFGLGVHVDAVRSTRKRGRTSDQLRQVSRSARAVIAYCSTDSVFNPVTGGGG